MLAVAGIRFETEAVMDQRLNDEGLDSPGPLLRLKDVLRRYPVCRSNWYDGVRTGIYPAPVRLGKRTVAWRQREIEKAIQEMNRPKDA